MKKTIGMFLSALALTLLASCGADAAASAAGKYELDKAAFLELMMANVPEAGREAAKPMLEKQSAGMVGVVELMADGKFKMNMAMPPAPAQNVEGTWKLDGDKLSMTSPKGDKDDTQVAMFKDGAITLEEKMGPMTIKMVFKKK